MPLTLRGMGAQISNIGAARSISVTDHICDALSHHRAVNMQIREKPRRRVAGPVAYTEMFQEQQFPPPEQDKRRWILSSESTIPHGREKPNENGGKKGKKGQMADPALEHELPRNPSPRRRARAPRRSPRRQRSLLPSPTPPSESPRSRPRVSPPSNLASPRVSSRSQEDLLEYYCLRAFNFPSQVAWATLFEANKAPYT